MTFADRTKKRSGPLPEIIVVDADAEAPQKKRRELNKLYDKDELREMGVPLHPPQSRHQSMTFTDSKFLEPEKPTLRRVRNSQEASPLVKPSTEFASKPNQRERDT